MRTLKPHETGNLSRGYVKLLFFIIYNTCLQVGSYNPLPSKDGVKEITANSDRIRYWVSVGAQPTSRVAWLFGKIGVLPPPPPRACDPERFKVPKKVYEKLQEEKWAALAQEFPERTAARAAVKAKVEARRKEKLAEKKSNKVQKGIN